MVAVVRIALWVVSYRRVRAVTARMSRPRVAHAPASAAARAEGQQRIAWAVTSAARFVPDASCLTQALVAKTLLDRERLDGMLRIGVAVQGRRKLRAHAWIQSGQLVLVGDDPHLKRFTVLDPPDQDSPDPR
jgi:Transglutaminase-like superfamily